MGRWRSLFREGSTASARAIILPRRGVPSGTAIVEFPGYDRGIPRMAATGRGPAGFPPGWNSLMRRAGPMAAIAE